MNLLNAVLLIKEAWNKVNTETIKNCFKKSKFCSNVLGLIENNETVLISNINKLDFYFNEYVEKTYNNVQNLWMTK